MGNTAWLTCETKDQFGSLCSINPISPKGSQHSPIHILSAKIQKVPAYFQGSLTSVDSHHCDFFCSTRLFFKICLPHPGTAMLLIFSTISSFFQLKKLGSYLEMSLDGRFQPQSKYNLEKFSQVWPIPYISNIQRVFRREKDPLLHEN